MKTVTDIIIYSRTFTSVTFLNFEGSTMSVSLISMRLILDCFRIGGINFPLSQEWSKVKWSEILLPYFVFAHLRVPEYEVLGSDLFNQYKLHYTAYCGFMEPTFFQFRSSQFVLSHLTRYQRYKFGAPPRYETGNDDTNFNSIVATLKFHNLRSSRHTLSVMIF